MSAQHFTIGLQHAYRGGCCREPRYAPVHDMHDALRMSCQNANCENERKGWVTVLNVQGDAQHAVAARFLEQDSGRRYIKLAPDDAADWFAVHGADAGMTLTPRLQDLIAAAPSGFLLYLFPPGQPCFRRHLDREVVFQHAGARGAKRLFENPRDFNESHNEEADKVNLLRQRG